MREALEEFVQDVRQSLPEQPTVADIERTLLEAQRQMMRDLMQTLEGSGLSKTDLVSLNNDCAYVPSLCFIRFGQEWSHAHWTAENALQNVWILQHPRVRGPRASSQRRAGRKIKSGAPFPTCYFPDHWGKSYDYC